MPASPRLFRNDRFGGGRVMLLGLLGRAGGADMT
jgi:hypothetical protein